MGTIQGSQPGGLDLITLFLLAEHLYLPSRNEHPVPSLRTGLRGVDSSQKQDYKRLDVASGFSFGEY